MELVVLAEPLRIDRIGERRAGAVDLQRLRGVRRELFGGDGLRVAAAARRQQRWPRARTRCNDSQTVPSDDGIEREFRTRFRAVKSVLRAALRASALPAWRAGPVSRSGVPLRATASAISRRTGLPTSSSNGSRCRPSPRASSSASPAACRLMHDILAAVVDFEPGNRLRVAAVEAFRHAQDRRKRLHGPAQRAGQLRIFVVRSPRRAAPVVARDERHHLDFVRMKAAQVAVLDQVVRMLVMARVADVPADVVHQRGVLQPLALAVGQPVNARASGRRARAPAGRPGWRARRSSCTARPAPACCGAARRGCCRSARSARRLRRM